MAVKDYSVYGKKFNRLTILRDGNTLRSTAPKVVAVCECGVVKEYVKSSITTGRTKSCGCITKEASFNVIHGHASSGKETPTYRTFQSMKTRCYRKRSREYPFYGGRGITVCDRWLQSFENFLIDMGERPVGCSLDRLDNNKGYSKENCRWATPKDQANNRRSSVFIEFNGKKQTVAQWASELGLLHSTINRRLKCGYPIVEVLDKKDRRLRKQ